MSFPHAEIEQKLGYTFKNKPLLEEAFTHVTYANAYGGKHNDRMEYLGDAVLQLAVTEWQYKKEQTATSGKMTSARQKLVCQSALDSAIDGLGVYGYLRYKGTEYNLKGKPKSSLFEAIVAAIYLDGGYAAAKRFIEKHGNIHLPFHATNAIGELKEFLEKRGQPPAREKERQKTGKEHAPHFCITLQAMDEEAIGEGKSVHEAKNVAAARLLWELQQKTETKNQKEKR